MSKVKSGTKPAGARVGTKEKLPTWYWRRGVVQTVGSHCAVHVWMRKERRSALSCLAFLCLLPFSAFAPQSVSGKVPPPPLKNDPIEAFAV